MHVRWYAVDYHSLWDKKYKVSLRAKGLLKLGFEDFQFIFQTMWDHSKGAYCIYNRVGEVMAGQTLPITGKTCTVIHSRIAR